MAAPMSSRPSDKQMEVLAMIIAHVSVHSFQPSQQEMANYLGISKNAIHNRLKGLASRGYIELSKELRERAIVLKTIRFMPYQCFDKLPPLGAFDEMFRQLAGGKLVPTKAEAEREIAKIDAKNAAS